MNSIAINLDDIDETVNEKKRFSFLQTILILKKINDEKISGEANIVEM